MTSRDVKRKHAFINKRFKEAGLERVISGSDGDTREMKFMLQHLGFSTCLSNLPHSKNSDEYRFFKLCPGLACNILETDFSGYQSQKFANYLMKSGREMLMGLHFT
ncbi:hypothetical protein OUZ56_017304 [Daphnia magna]|uniref:Uncharacterized protein n=1 Tax=Daphnia magna TaxID=35525 RepID=A0ABR0ASM4_9CRUS|nr:hypothetical protein OUZ56_017304 [Daphnia magna]